MIMVKPAPSAVMPDIFLCLMLYMLQIIMATLVKPSNIYMPRADNMHIRVLFLETKGKPHGPALRFLFISEQIKLQ